MLSYSSSPLPKAGAHRHSDSSSSPDASRSSSLNVWSEDYYSDDAHASTSQENYFNEILTSPKPATLTERPFPRSIPLSYDEEPAQPRQPRTHQRSLTALLPFRSPQRSPERSPQRTPVKEREDYEFMPTLTGDKDGQIKIEDKGKTGLSSWFSGSSAPIPVGLQVEEFVAMAAVRESSPERSPTKLQKRPTAPLQPVSLPKQAAASTSRFNFFSPKPAAQTVQIPQDMSDEFLTLDVNASLFPNGPVDPFSPSAFKNLLQNAEGLLTKLQSAYQQRTISLHELTAEKSAQEDELEEAETRAMHLKRQLEGMASQVVEQDEEIANLKAQLVAERRARADEKEAREKSIALIKSHRTSPSDASISSSMIDSEDLEVPSRGAKKWRQSDSSVIFSESDDDDSVFSRSMSPTLSTMTSTTAPEVGQATQKNMRPVANQEAIQLAMGLQKAVRPKPVQQRSTFQKMLGRSAEAEAAAALEKKKKEEEEFLGSADEGCRNCRGGSASVAWDTVGLMRAENKGLKERVGELESAVEGALDLVAGLR